MAHKEVASIEEPELQDWTSVEQPNPSLGVRISDRHICRFGVLFIQLNKP